jgi:hypothetical protein
VRVMISRVGIEGVRECYVRCVGLRLDHVNLTADLFLNNETRDVTPQKVTR